MCAITAGIKKHMPIIKRNKQNKIPLLAKTKLNAIEVLISRTLIDSSISDDVLNNNVLREYDVVKDYMKNLKTSSVH